MNRIQSSPPSGLTISAWTFLTTELDMNRTLHVSSGDARKKWIPVSKSTNPRCSRGTVAVEEIAAAMLTTTISAWTNQSGGTARRCPGKSDKIPV